MRFTYALAVIVSTATTLSGISTTTAQDAPSAPVYSRTRGGADMWDNRGGRGYGHPGYGYGYFQPYYPPVVASSWYERPYPYHFDYFRDRWSRAAAGPTNDCPCAEAGVPANSPELLPQVDAAATQ